MIISPTAISPYKIPTYQSGGGAPPFSFGNALQFDGVNDFVSLNTPISEGSSDLTISYWFKQNATISGLSAHLRPINLGTTFIGMLNATTYRFTTQTGSTDDFLVPTVNDLNWHHFLITYEVGIGSRLYFDGTESVTGLKIQAQTLQINALGIYSTSTYGNITLDEISVYNTVLDASARSGLFNGGNGDYATNYSPANLLAYFRCNEADGATTLADETGNYNGTLNNFSTPPAYFIPH